MDPECEGEFGDLITELHLAEWNRFVERLEARDAWRDKPEEAEVARAVLLELVSEQEERLETLLAAHLERESAADPDGWGSRTRRRASDCVGTRSPATRRCCGYWRRCGDAIGRRPGRRKEASGAGGRPLRHRVWNLRSEADLLRETFGPVIAQGQEPGARQVGEGEPSSGAELLRETFGRVNGRGPETRAQQSEAVPSLGLVEETRAQQSEAVPSHDLVGLDSPDPTLSPGLVGRGSPDPARARPQVSRSDKTQRTKPPPLLLSGEDLSPTSRRSPSRLH